MTQAVVVIPVVKPYLTDTEKISLERCLMILGRWPIVLVSPQDLDLTEVMQICGDGVVSKRFDSSFFDSIASYNRLMVSSNFYDAFRNYDFMLLYQLDAFVFEDQLEAWCRKGYDYIGAPAFNGSGFECLPLAEADRYARELASHRLVLNGGLSLRKISAMKRLIRLYNLFYPSWVGNEDMLFSLDSTRLIPLKPFMSLPKWREALDFSFEKSPAASFGITNGELPFGCHAWEKYDPDFWQAHIPGLAE